MQRTLFRLLSLFLTLVLLVNMLPMSIFAAELQQFTAELQQSADQKAEEVSQSITPSEAYILQEIPEKRTEYSKEFLLSNGLRMAAVYPEAVHYEEDGQWTDIDNTLKAHSDGTYRNTAGVWEVRFPDQLTKDNSVSVTKDGYTLSFAMAGELTGGNQLMSTETLSLGKVTPSTAQVQKLSSRKEEVKHPETVSDKLHSRLTYSKVYSNTNIQYDLTYNKVKESIIIESYNSSLRGYRYTLDVGEMIPVLEESGQILFYDKEQKNVVMVMPAPYLVDDNHEYNTNIQVQLVGKGSTYVLTYLLPQQWLAEEERAWPVILDPVITADMNVNNIRDMTVASGRIYPNIGVLDAGYYTDPTDNDVEDEITRFYLKYDNLPAITSSDVIIHAEIRLRKIDNSSSSAPIEVHKVTGTWDSSTITWGNKPAHNTTVEDVVTVQNAGHYTWEITDIAQGWYSSTNTGMMFKAPDSIENDGVNNYKQFYSSDYTDDDTYQPFLAIVFRNNNGLESYWDYTSSSAGRAGTGYVNNFTGNLTWIREDIGFGGNRMPVSIQHVYNLNDATLVSDNNLSNDTAGNFFGLGNGWRTNYHQRVKYMWSGCYLWEDADGTDHYFFKDTPGLYGAYKDEDGLELTFTNTGSGIEFHCITDKDGNKSFFDFHGRLTKLQNNQATPSSITITYTTDTGPLIHTITDGAGRKYTFNYANDKYLGTIIYTGTGDTEIAHWICGYDSNLNLVRINDQDGRKSYYTYTGNVLTTVTDPGGYKLTYTYNTPAHTWQPYRVQSVTEADGTTAGGSLSIAYAHNQTTFTDHNGNVEIHQFNNFGNTVCIQDDEGRAQYTQFAFNTDDEKSANTNATKKSNQLRLSSKLQNSVGNRLASGSFEGGELWSVYPAGTTVENVSDTAYSGNRSLRITASQWSCIMSGNFTIEAGATYTFSAYVKGVVGDSFLMITNRNDMSSSMIQVTHGSTDWIRAEVSYTNTSTSAIPARAHLYCTAGSQAYIDCAQVEMGNSASRYNLVKNGDFTHSSSNSVAYGWSNGGHIESTEVRQAIPSAAVQLDGWAYRVTGGASRQKHLYQYLPISGNAGDSYVLSGWGKGNSVPLREYNGEKREFSIVGTFCNNDGSTTVFTIPFNPDVENWQYAAGGMIADKPYSQMIIELKYNFNANTVYFDGIQLFKEEFGNVYDYDTNGNVKSVRDLQGQKTQYEYQNNNLTKTILPTGAELTYTYDNYHNVKAATTEEGLVYNFGYDTYGNNTSVSIGSGTNAITATATYSTDGNRLVSTTDAAGNTTTYGYNAQTNVLDWVKYPEDTDTTKTTYTYDSMYRMASAAATTDTGLNMSAQYTYTDDNLTELQTPSTTYGFTYGAFDVRTSVKAGSLTLATYSYTDNANRYLSRLDYGNGDRVQYTYDDKGRVLRQTYEDGAYISYTYDNSGILTKQYDSATGRTTVYTYDTTGRLMKYTETGTNYSHSVTYDYDPSNNLSTLMETTNGVTTTTSYTYDDDNRVTSVTSGGVTKTYTYDAFGRVSQQQTKNGSTVIMTESYTYNGATTQVSAVTRTGPRGASGTLYYEYDDNGNITSIGDGSESIIYLYDSQNQLTTEYQTDAGIAKCCEYDGAGNIVEWYQCDFDISTGEPEGIHESIRYDYDDPRLCDVLTERAHESFGHDSIGNMTSDYTWTYTWEHGRQLASMSDGLTTWEFSYDANGMRTQRTNGTDTYTYTYNGGQLTQMTKGTDTLKFTYDASGTPMTVTWNGTLYYYATNLQGDVTDILNANGYSVASYSYDAWGDHWTADDTLTKLNPLRYRGYVYDQETGLYYVGSRYYNPEMGRWINADGQISGANGDFLGHNQFAYCFNNPVNMDDPSGNWPKWLSGALNVVGGALQVAAGAALGATVGWTGFGAVAAGFLIVNGTATVAQGVGQIVNHVAKSNVMREDNIVRTAVQEVGRVIGGDTGAKVAGGVYDVAVVAANIYAGKVGLQQAGIAPVKVNINNVINNPADEFVTIGPADGVIEQYCRTIPQSGYGKIYATQLENGLYQIANGHHRVAALRILGYETIKIFLTK